MNHFKINFFFGLCFLFLPYTFFVYTLGTEENNQKKKSGKVAEGKLLFQKHNCISCHQIYGLGGYLGPELTTVISTKGEQLARAFIENGTLRMPNFHLSEHEISALIEYLKYVDSTAETYKPSDKKLVNDGK